MKKKLFHFGLVFFFFLLVSFVRSETEVNTQLQLDFNCSTTGECHSSEAFCNSAGKCQCLFGYSPNGRTCEMFHCGYPGAQKCSQLFNDSHAECNRIHQCNCNVEFEFNADTHKCDKRNTRLGGHCVADDECGKSAECTTSGQCRCPIGSRPYDEFSCTYPFCTSNEFCHVNVTANTICEPKNGYCICQNPVFKKDSDTFECVRVLPDPPLPGEPCNNSTYCGKGASCTAGNVQICKCRPGYEVKNHRVCERIPCDNDEYCHKIVSPLTTCYRKEDKYNSVCGCSPDNYEHPQTLECSGLPKIGEPCASRDGNHHRPSCGSNAYCNDDQKCVCHEGYKARNKNSSECEKIV